MAKRERFLVYDTENRPSNVTPDGCLTDGGGGGPIVIYAHFDVNSAKYVFDGPFDEIFEACKTTPVVLFAVYDETMTSVYQFAVRTDNGPGFRSITFSNVSIHQVSTISIGDNGSVYKQDKPLS